MDRNREARRATMAATNGLSRRRHRSSSLRDSPEEDGPVELQETARLRDRVAVKKDRDNRDRDRDRDRDRLSRSKRRRGDRLMHGSNREDGVESSEESVNDEEEEDDDDGGVSVRMLPPNPTSLSTTSTLNHRKSFPPPAKVFRAPPTWRAADEMIGVSVPRKARSASTKRSPECWASSGVVGGDQIHRQASTSPVRPTMAAASPARPVSPSSSNASARKKMKPNGTKQRPPKSSSKSSSSAQDEIEIEIAEVLYGMGMMRQPLGPKQEILGIDSKDSNKSSSSRVSSPISNSQSLNPQSSSILLPNSCFSHTPMSMSGTAPKRKRPRPVKYDDENSSIITARNSSISSATKIEVEHSTKIETSSPNSEKNPGSAAENGGIPSSRAAPPEPEKPVTGILSVSKSPLIEELEKNSDVGVTKEEPQSPKKESSGLRLNVEIEDAKATKSNSAASESERLKEEKFQIDLMAPPPPPLRSSPERDGGDTDFAASDPKPMVQDVQTDLKPMVKEDDKAVRIGKEEAVGVAGGKKTKVIIEEVETQKPILNKEGLIDLQYDLEKSDRDSSNLNQHVQKQQQQKPNPDKTAQTNSLPLPMPVANWPGGIPSMGYMAPLQGVVSMDGSAVSSAAMQPPHLLFTQPRPKKCATHCYIARNICYHQQLSRMNPFWPAAAAAAAGAASIYGGKPSNLNVMPSTELLGNIPGRSVNSVQEKGPALATFPGHTGKDKAAHAAMVDAGQRKQILLQQALPTGAPSNILHGPTFIFPLSQQQSAAAISVRPGSVKSPPAASGAASSSASNSASASASATAPAAAPMMSLNYPSMPANETQYLAILPNNGYPFPIPAHVGAPPAYRGPQAMPFFNGSFYSSQMLHPSQLQQQQPSTQSLQAQQAHQNASISSGSSSSQKHLQNQLQRQQGSAINGSGGNLKGFPAPKNQPSQPQQRQQQQNQHFPSSHQARQLENEMGGEDSPSTADSRVSRTNMGVYGQNFAIPIHPPNFALTSPASMGGAGGAASGIGNNSEKKQQQGSKAGVEILPSQAFAMSFASINGATTAPGYDISSIAQNHTILQSLPGHGYQIMAAAAQAAQQKKTYRVSEEGKSGGGDSSIAEEERKAMAGKGSATMGQSIAFSRPDLTDSSVSSLPGNTVIDSSARALNLGSGSARASGSVMPTAIGTVNGPTSQQQQQRQQLQQQQQHQQQMIQLHKQQQYAAAAAAAARNKMPATSNGSVYSDQVPSSSMAAKFPNALSAFPQNLVQSSSSPAQSPQWKNSVKMTTSQAPSPSLASSTSSLKNLPQQVRTQPSHTQISFAANSKSSATGQGQQPPNNHQSPSPPMVVGSPTTSSVSKSAGGSPRPTTTTSTGAKTTQASSLSLQQTKNSASVPGRKSSPVGGRAVPSIVSNSHITSSSSTTTKPQLQQQQQQQQLPKHALQHAQLFFSNAFMQAPHSASTTSTATATSGGYYIQRRRTEQQQQSHGSSATSSTGMLSLCPPVTMANATSTTDPTKAVNAAAAASNVKGGSLPSQFAQFAAAQSSGNPHQLVSAGFPYVHAVPSAVQVKPAEQKQPTGE